MNLGYDALNLPVSGYNGASFAYDNAGRMTAANLSGLALGFTWDALNRQISQSSPQGTITRQFDLNGNRTQLKYPDGYYANYAFDAAGELTSISDPSSITLMNLAYDNLGRPTSISRYQGQTETLGYGSDLRLSSLGYSFADTSKNVTFSYTYNLAGQPVSATASNAAYRNTSARVAAAYASDGLNRYSAVGASSLTYDGRSNLSSTGLQGFGYDGLNRMTSTAGTTLVYDALDRLNQVVSGSGTKFLYEGQQIIAEYNGSGALQRRYIPGPGLDNPYSGSKAREPPAARPGGFWAMRSARSSRWAAREQRTRRLGSTVTMSSGWDRPATWEDFSTRA